MPTLKKTHLVTKRNLLNEISAESMTLTEIRFFNIYLSRINKDMPKTRLVKFPLDEFKQIMGFAEGSRINVKHMQNATNSLLCKIVNVPIKDEAGNFKGYSAFQLFKECTVSKNDDGEWYVEIDAHDKALPLMFDYKNKYFSYRLENVENITSKSQYRMYELLKQYEKIGVRIISIEELKRLLGIGKDEYKGRWDNFKTRVLETCQKSLEEDTDIKFKYEPHGKRGPGGSITALKFIIEKNYGYKNQISFDEYMAEHNTAPDIEENEKNEISNKKERRIIEIVETYKALDYGDFFGSLSNDEYLELNQAAFDYLIENNRTNELELQSLVSFTGKQVLYTNRQNPKHYYNYLLKAIKENYANC